MSEHQYITVESLKLKRTTINNKGKVREIAYPKTLTKMLFNYCQKYHIKKGPIFITKNGNPINRTSIWRDMKKLCQ